MFASRIDSAGTINNAWSDIGLLQVEPGSGIPLPANCQKDFNLILILEYG